MRRYHATLLGSDGTDRPDVGRPRPARASGSTGLGSSPAGRRLHPPERHGQGPDRVRLVGRFGDVSGPGVLLVHRPSARKASRGPSFRPAGGMPHSGSSFSTMPTCVGRGTRLAHCCRFSSRLTRQVPRRRDGIGHLSGPACRTGPLAVSVERRVDLLLHLVGGARGWTAGTCPRRPDSKSSKACWISLLVFMTTRRTRRRARGSVRHRGSAARKSRSGCPGGATPRP